MAKGSLSAAERKAIGAALAKAVDRAVKTHDMCLYAEPREKGGRSVYVLQLDPAVFDCPKCGRFFDAANDRRVAVYVGKTNNTIAERIAEHRAFTSHELRRGKASVVAPHLIAGDPRIEVVEGHSGRPLEQRIKFQKDQRLLEEVVLPRVLRRLGFGVHAGDTETSMMLALRPGKVRMDQAQNFRSTSQDRAERFEILGNGKSAKLGWQMQDYNRQGAAGNAAAATAEKGQALLDASGRALAQLLGEIDRLPPDTLRDQVG